MLALNFLLYAVFLGYNVNLLFTLCKVIKYTYIINTPHSVVHHMYGL
jgi:hypothetical protein